MTPNYNDGNWHGWNGWNGGECPVHPETVIVGVEPSGTVWKSAAYANDWASFRGRFSVFTPYVEPAPAPVMTTPMVARYDLREIIFNRNALSIAGAFIWWSTPEGHDFWQENEKTPEGLVRWEQMKAQFDAELAPETPTKPAKRDLRTIDDHELFGELDERTQKRLRKADKRGWPVQWFDGVVWEACRPSFHSYFAYRLDPAFTPPAKRVKPAPVVETITQDMWQDVHGELWNYARLVSTPVTVTITFTRTNGVIDNDSYKVEVKP